MNIRTVYVEITNQCNLNCRTCYNRSGLNRTRREISAEELRGVMAVFLPYGLRRLLISGGEPLLHSGIEEVLDLPGWYPELSFGIVTNGTVPCPKLNEVLAQNPGMTVQVSLDGSGEEQNARTRGAGNFAKAAAFVKNLPPREEKPLLKMVISRRNLEDVEPFYRRALSLGAVPEFAFLFRAGNGCEGWEEECLSAREQFAVLKLVDRLNRECGMEAFLPLCTSRCPYSKELEDLSLCVKTDGSIQPCQTLYGEEYALGNVFAFSPAAFEERLRETAAVARRRLTADYGCGSCLLSAACGRGCMAQAVNLHGDPLADDGDCALRKLQAVGYYLKDVRKTK